MASLDVGNYIKDVQMMDLISSNRVSMVWDLELRSSSDTFTVAALASTDSVASLTAGISVEAGQPVNGQTTVQVTGGTAGTRAVVVTAGPKGVSNNNSLNIPGVTAGDFAAPVLGQGFPWDTAVLTWGAVTDDAGNSPTGYKLSRSLSTGGPYTLIKTTASLTYTDTTASVGTAYYYVVIAYDVTRESSNSNEQTITPIANVSEQSLTWVAADNDRLAVNPPFGQNFLIPNDTTHQVSGNVWARRNLSDGANYRAFFGMGRGSGGVPGENLIAMRHEITTQLLAVGIQSSADSDNEKKYVSSAALPAVGEWFMFSFTFDGTNNADALKLYVNGVLDESPTKLVDEDISGMVHFDTTPCSLGNSAYGGWECNHTISSITTWDDELTAAEITAIYNGGSGSTFVITANNGDYVSAANLQNAYYPGRAPSDPLETDPGLGIDYGPNALSVPWEGELGPTDDNRTTDIPDGT